MNNKEQINLKKIERQKSFSLRRGRRSILSENSTEIFQPWLQLQTSFNVDSKASSSTAA